MPIFLNLTTLTGVSVAVNLNQVKAIFRMNSLNRSPESYEAYPNVQEYTTMDLGDDEPLQVRESFKVVNQLVEEITWRERSPTNSELECDGEEGSAFK